MNRILLFPILLAALIPLASPCHAAAPCDYAVVSKQTHSDPQWKKVVDALVKKHNDKYHAQVIEYASEVNESLGPLRTMFPRYAAFVAQPEEASREFVIKIHRLTRKLDDDPYTDVLWGIVTGYSADDALRIVNTSEPLTIHRGAAGTGMDLNLFDEGFVVHEGSDDEYTEKTKGGKPEKKHGEANAAKPIVDLFEQFKKGKSYEIVFTAKEVDRSVAAAAPPADETDSALALVPAKYRTAVTAQLAAAGTNRAQLTAALKAVPEQQREGLAFLIANMPQQDLESLSKDFLLSNLQFAYKARAEVPWGAKLPDEIFLNDVLPYASINERRDDWRKDFYNRFIPIVKKCKTAAEAAIVLNKETFQQFGVHYNAQKRPKPDQSPYESIKAKYASCTGLSVLAIDAFRAVAIPARFVGVPQWTGSPGNHSWAEVWDGSWHILGAAESSHLDEVWFTDKAAKANPANPMNRIYATSYAKTGIWFPLVWDRFNESVPAIDVTACYQPRRNMSFRVMDSHGKPVNAAVALRLGGHVLAAGSGKSAYDFTLPGGLACEAQVQSAGRQAKVQKIELPKEGSGPIDLHM
jgi:hypothetical protein